MAVLEGILSMQVEVVLNALGRNYNTQIAGLPARLILPGPPTDPNGIGLSGGDLVEPHFTFPDSRPALTALACGPGSRTGWGKCYLRDPTGDDEAAVWRCGLVVAVDDERTPEQKQAVADELFGAVDAWRAGVYEWLSVVFGRDRLPQVSRPGAGASVEPWLWTSDVGGAEERFCPSAPLNVVISPDAALSRVSLRKVLELAGAGERPPLAWRLLVDARREAARGDGRRAVLDAATAAELALTEILPRQGQVLRPLDMLRDLVRKANKVPSLSVPGDAEPALVRKRNKAVHEGKLPTHVEGVRAVEIAAVLVEAAWPRADLI